MAEKNCFDMTIFQIMCVTVVQCSRSYLHVQFFLQISCVRLPATLFSVFCTVVFSCLVSLFLIFPFGLFSLFLLLTLLVMHLDQYVFKLKSGVLFWKNDFKSSWSAYWPSLRPDKNHKPCQDMSLLWNSWIFSMLVDIVTNNTQYTTNCTSLHPTPISDTLAKVKLAFRTSS